MTIDPQTRILNSLDMRSLLPKLILVSLLTHAISAFAFSVDEIAPGIFVHHGQQVSVEDRARGDSANLAFVVGKRCIAVIDTGGSIVTGRAWRAAIAARSQLPICYVINTHGHFDHVLGNAAFVASGVEFLGHPALVDTLEASREFFASRFAPELAGAPEPAIITPTQVVESRREIDLGDRLLVLSPQALAHSAADLTVFDSTSGTLFTGDLLSVTRLPVLDGSLRGWQVWMRETLVPVRVVPGHGPLVPWARAIAAQAGYLSGLEKTARSALDDGVFLEDLVEAAHSAVLEGWILTSPHARNLSKAYRELEWE
jgi:quinoprotein relay system zinc metallohydrolase 2